MVTVRTHPEYDRWYDDLRDQKARARIDLRIRRMQDGNFGDAAPVGEGVSEFRIHYGPGYRLYGVQRGPHTLILLCGGTKGSQQRDITKAKKLHKDLED